MCGQVCVMCGAWVRITIDVKKKQSRISLLKCNRWTLSFPNIWQFLKMSMECSHLVCDQCCKIVMLRPNRCLRYLTWVNSFDGNWFLKELRISILHFERANILIMVCARSFMWIQLERIQVELWFLPRGRRNFTPLPGSTIFSSLRMTPIIFCTLRK